MKSRVWVLLSVLLALACRTQETEPGTPAGPSRPQSPSPAQSDFLEDTEIPLGTPGTDGCAAADNFTILLDGGRTVDPRYRAVHGQPSVAIRVTEPGGEVGLLLVDVGGDAAALEKNLGTWLADGDGSRASQRAVVLSHAHTFAGWILPLPPDGKRPSPGVFEAIATLMGEYSLQAPNSEDLCGLGPPPDNGGARRICGARTGALKPGLAPLVWHDGSLSQRIHTLTYPISPEERDEVPFQPLETAVVVASGKGYLVYTACSHTRQSEPDATTSPFHAVELVKAEMDRGKLPPGPVHTLVSGTCGMVRGFELSCQREGKEGFDGAQFAARLRRVGQAVGLKEVFVAHCAFAVRPETILPLFHQEFPDGLRLAFPGTCIPLESSGPQGP